MSKRKGYALATHTHYVDDKTDLLVSRSGGIYSVGCTTANGEVVQIEMTEQWAHLLWEFLTWNPPGKRCDQCDLDEVAT